MKFQADFPRRGVPWYTGRMAFRRFFVAVLAGVAVGLTSCGTLGYSVVLWNNPEHQLQDGQIVKVFIKSNISHVYVVALPDGKRAEIPLWQLTEPAGKKAAEKTAARYADYAHTYASVKLDGLPIRAEAVNTSRQVYRLRQKEVIRVLYQGTGQAVTNGQGNMAGEWLRVLTNGGTQGWCFSYNLELFRTDGEGGAPGAESEAGGETADAAILQLPGKNWYPESFQGMIQAKRIDPAKMSERYRFVLDTEAQRVGITLENTALSWTYTGISKSADGMYHFVGTPVALRVRGADEIAVQFAGADGKQRAQTFIALDEDIAQLVQEERARRVKELERVRMLGPSFVSSNYGRLQFMEGGAFFWSGYQLLVPTIIAQSAGNGGTVGVQYFISNALKNSYDGILSFRFSGMTKDVHFLYKLTDDGLRLEDATHAQIANGVVTGRGTSPLVIFFSHSTEH